MCVHTDFRIVVVPLVRATCYRTHCPISRIIIPRSPLLFIDHTFEIITTVLKEIPTNFTQHSAEQDI